MDTSALARTELLQVADAVAREKSIERDEVLEAMEQAISKAGRAKYGHEHDIRAEIDRDSGEIRLARYMEVTDDVENEATQLTLDQARRVKAEFERGNDVAVVELGSRRDLALEAAACLAGLR